MPVSQSAFFLLSCSVSRPVLFFDRVINLLALGRFIDILAHYEISRCKGYPVLVLAVFASGNGSNLQALMDFCKFGKLNVKIAAVISNNSNSYALTRAQNAGIATYHISQKKYPDYVDYITQLITVLEKNSINLIVLAGYMKLFPREIVDRYCGRIINIHPALLPKFGGSGMYGIRVHQAVLDAREQYSGATVHMVDSKFDHGPILIQRRIRVNPDDTPESLATRVLEIEHQILPEAVALFIK